MKNSFFHTLLFKWNKKQVSLFLNNESTPTILMKKCKKKNERSDKYVYMHTIYLQNNLYK